MMSHRDFSSALTIAALLSLASGQQMALTAGGFGPTSPSVAGPRIVWTPPAPFARVNFTLTSAASSDSASRYVSFAFANGPKMNLAMTVVDCYEVGGTVILGTSRNVNLVNTGSGNVNEPSARSELTLLAAGKPDGVLTCQFSMDFGSTLNVNVLLASGLMDTASTVSSPIKKYHAERYASTNTVATPSAVATVPAVKTVPAVTAVAASEASGTTAKTASSRTTGASSAGARKLTFAGFSPSSPSAGGPRIVWTAPAVNEWGNFTLTTAASTYSSNRYVSFAFASGRRMSDTFTIIDCLEIAGVATMGTSRNTPSGTNVNDPDSRNQVYLQYARKVGGVLTCSFAMKFPPAFDVYVILATGPLAVGASVSSPTKLYHGANGRFSSDLTIGRLLSSAATTKLAPTTLMLLAAITLRMVCWR